MTLNQRIDEAAVDREEVWLVASALPLEPRAPVLGRPDRAAAIQILTKTLASNPFLVQAGGRSIDAYNPRPGHRRWRGIERDNHGTVHSFIDLHDDGGVTMAVRNAMINQLDFGAEDVHPLRIAEFVGDLIWLVRNTARTLGVQSFYTLRIEFRWDGLYGPLYFRWLDMIGHPASRDEGLAITHFIPIIAQVDPQAADDKLLEVVREIATDVINQGGIMGLGQRYIRTSLQPA